MKIIIIAFFAVNLLFAAGCSRPVATVDGKKIDRKTFDIHLKEKIQKHKQQNVTPDVDKLRDAVIQELISEKLILEAAYAKGIQVSDKDVNQQIEIMRKSTTEDAFDKALKEKGLTLDDLRERTREKMVMSNFIKSLVKDDDVTEEEISEYYKNSQKPFIKPGRVYMKMIELNSEEEATSIADEMKSKKADFEDIAKNLSDEKKAVVSDYGWVNPDLFSPSISQAIKDLNPGEYGGPYKGQKSFFLIKIKDREKESVAKFDEVKENIRKFLLEQKRQSTITHLIAQKKKTAKIEININ
jgi:parvulin-like peptidyl-prolyl isomerase